MYYADVKIKIKIYEKDRCIHVVIVWCFDYQTALYVNMVHKNGPARTYLFDANAKVSRSKMIWEQRLRLLESSLS